MTIAEYREYIKTAKTPSKYGNVKTEYKGVKYDSIKEANHAKHLDMMLKGKKIKSWRGQVPFVLQDKFTDNRGVKHQAIKYIADFEVVYKDGKVEVQDVKASEDFVTDVYKIKKKLLLYKYPKINFVEIYKTK